MPPVLADQEVQSRLAQLTGWALHDGRLRQVFRFRDFAQAFGFMAASAVVAERLNHHPDWSNAYNVVSVELTTHDAGGLTALDFELAQHMNRLAAVGAVNPDAVP